VGVYFYILPTYTQARKIIWDGIDKDGLKFIDHIPKDMILGKPNSTDMKVTLTNGSIIQLVGSDQYNRIMGTNPIGVVMSEYSLQNPMAWEYIRPILAENDGWAIFNYTPRGKNHGHDLYTMAVGNDDWFCEMLTVDDTKAITLEAIEAEKASGMSAEMIRQEFYCSFEGTVQGSYYSQLITDARNEGRIKTLIPIEPAIPVDTYWDLGINDSTTIWFVQKVGMERRVVGYYENSGEGLAFYARELDRIALERKWKYGRHIAPHDIKVRELGTGVSRLETAKLLGIKFEVAPSLSLQEGIDATRTILPTVFFDETHCAHGIKCLENYRKDWDEINRTFKKNPMHDWASHGADGFRMFAITAHMFNLRDRLINKPKQEEWIP